MFQVVSKRIEDNRAWTVFATTIKANETLFLIHRVKWEWVNADDYIPLGPTSQFI
jgi:hypothetical protein